MIEFREINPSHETSDPKKVKVVTEKGKELFCIRMYSGATEYTIFSLENILSRDRVTALDFRKIADKMNMLNNQDKGDD